MASPAPTSTLVLRSSKSRTSILTTAILCALTLMFALPARAQTFTVLHTFGGSDGEYPYTGVTITSGGNLYGTTSRGGTYQGGVAYELKHSGSVWSFMLLYQFGNGSDGSSPYASLVFGPDGALYGTTALGGSGNGTAFNLQPPAAVCKTTRCLWHESTIWSFQGSDGSLPAYGALAFDQQGNGYGTTQYGGTNNKGTVYKLTRQGQQWTETVLYSFGSTATDGYYPLHNVVLDHAGNLYGTTYQGGANGGGAVFQLVPAGGSWTENIITSFPAGAEPQAGLIIDASGNLYGATTGIGTSGTSEVFELSPSGNSWQLTSVHAFPTTSQFNFGPVGNLVMDHNGNLYGATYSLGVHGKGNIFELTPSGNSWTYIDLYDFRGGSDGGGPIGDLNLDASGNVYGTTQNDGTGLGVVWELAP
jgi:uncharacterized repeat protein (TIGR03803 family)